MAFVSDEAKSFLSRLLQRESEKRPSAREALQDPWILKYSEKGEKIIKNSLANLRTFSVQMSLQKAVLAYMASQQLSKEEEARIKSEFALLDLDQDGSISTRELFKAYLNLYGDEETATKEARKTMEQVDVNQNGTIDYNG